MKTHALSLYRKTDRLIIRYFELHDYDNWMQAHSSMREPQNEWDETNWDESELTLKKYKEFLKKQTHLRAQDKFYEFGIFRKDDGLLVGSAHLMDLSRGIFQNAYLGYRIYNTHWGQGYATEACKAALAIAFKDLNLHRVEAGIAPKNRRSIRVAKAIGMRKEGLSARRIFSNGKWVDLVLYAATSEDFGIKYRFSQK
ncbi:GNAT family N-acetyltransferase [Bdellovibrio sp. HCB2-146]|uniref:GNAT family N-acetyltransferase n=1 Tax=Bdellovibrio sp. HCB2-146 TaxID=3394362 RepID=UPI0039BCDA9D